MQVNGNNKLYLVMINHCNMLKCLSESDQQKIFWKYINTYHHSIREMGKIFGILGQESWLTGQKCTIPTSNSINL